MQYIKQTLWAALCGVFFAGAVSSCTTEKSDAPIPRSQRVQLSLTSSSTEKIRPTAQAGDNFFFVLSARDSWSLSVQPAEAQSWLKLERTHGEAAQGLRIVASAEANLGTPREAFIIANVDGAQDTLRITQPGLVAPPTPTPDPTPVNPAGEHILGDVTLLEAPALAGGSNNYYITYRANNIVNYSVEYDVDRRHPRFVCFTFDDTNSAKVVGRTDTWAWDPQIPSQYSTARETHRDYWIPGFDRGHMVASSDRLFSREANNQTFYYTNMSPQLSGLNQHFWNDLEQLVQDWGRNSSLRDVLYVAKGGTIRDDQVWSRKSGPMVIPNYYWMAVVLRKGSTYHGLAFYVKHEATNRGADKRAYVMSIDQLEQQLGMDLFHNFPDDIERQFEAEVPTNPAYLSAWPGL